MFAVYKQSFFYLNVPTINTQKKLFVLAANRPLVDTLISIDDIYRTTKRARQLSTSVHRL